MHPSEKILSVNEAGLHLYSDVKGLSLWAQTVECYQCDIVQRKPLDNGTLFIFDTQFDWILELHNSTKHKLITRQKTFEEHSVYNWTYTKFEDELVLANEFIDPVLIFYVIVAVLVLCAVLWRLISWSFRRSRSLRRIFRLLSTIDEIENDLGSPDEANELIAQASNVVPRERQHRVKSVDVFRGITICSMIFVDYGGGQYWFFDHSAWNGLTFADVIFPWFAWIMGLSIVLKVKSEVRNMIGRKSLVLKIAYRSCLLICLGIIVTNLRQDDLSTIRIPGVLQRLGLAYFIVGALEATFMMPQPNSESSKFSDFAECWKQWIFVCLLVLLHSCITFYLPVPSCPTGYLGPGGEYIQSDLKNCTGGAAAYIDKLIFAENHLYHQSTCRKVYKCSVPYDPEGLLGLLTTVLCVYFGVHAGRILQVYKFSGQRLKRWLLLSMITMLSAFTLCGFSVDEGPIPLNKNLWSLSFVLMCSGLAFSIFSILYVFVDMMKWWEGSPFYQTGMNSLVLYIGHVVCQDTFPWQWKTYTPRFHAEYVIMDLWATTLWILIAIVLYRRNIFVTV